MYVSSRQGYKPPVKSTGRGEKGFELGTEILKQGANLKLSGAERITDMIIEKKQEEVKTIVLFAKSNNYERYLFLGNISVYNRNCNNDFCY